MHPFLRRTGEPGVLPKTVHIVSDSSLARLGAVNLLREQPCFSICKESATPEEAIADVKIHNPDLVLLSMSLKNGMGLDFIARMKQANSRHRILVTSNYEDSLYAGLALNAGAAGYMGNGAGADEILYGLCELAEGRMFVSPTIAQKMLCEVADANQNVPPNPLHALTQREFEVFELIGRGETTRRIARKLDVSVHTVETYRERMRTKLGIHNSTELAFRAIVWVLLH